MQNVQAALAKAGLGGKVNVYQSPSGKPSDGDFRDDIHCVMRDIVRFLDSSDAPFVANVYPFISLYLDPHFPLDYAFFQGSSTPVVDGAITYENTFDANYDTLVAALRRNGFPDLPIVVGEVGWPTDGDANANPEYARRFNQGLLDHIASGKGTPLRPGVPVDAYLFSLVDEDQKSIQPGNFERHWGVFYYDGQPKYPLSLRGDYGGGTTLVPAKGVEYLKQRWCVFNPDAELADQKVGDSVSYACGKPTAPASGTRPPAAASTPGATCRTRSTASTRATTRTTSPATSAGSPPPPPSTPPRGSAGSSSRSSRLAPPPRGRSPAGWRRSSPRCCWHCLFSILDYRCFISLPLAYILGFVS
uniref:Uncharacterized protein n=1 Tax=Avena sativa TaxID=4498 RepID=A0ACD5ZQY0_AVESA